MCYVQFNHGKSAGHGHSRVIRYFSLILVGLNFEFTDYVHRWGCFLPLDIGSRRQVSRFKIIALP
jgi:hypothetical protein